MWTLKFLALTSILALSIEAGTLTCYFNGGTTCGYFTLENVTRSDEPIVVINATSGEVVPNFIDLNTTSFSVNFGTFGQLFVSVSAFPSKLFDIFPKTNFFSIAGITLNELGPNSFDNCNYLDDIFLGYLNIASIKEGFARNCLNLKIINMVSSNVQSIDENAFEGLNNLEIVNFDGNSITCLPPLLFHHTKNLLMISFIKNKITALHSELFAGLRKLEVAYFENNSISYVPNFNLIETGLEAPSTVFTLNNNPIDAISPSLLTTLEKNNRLDGSDHPIAFQILRGEENLCVAIVNASSIEGFNYDLGTSPFAIQNSVYASQSKCYDNYNESMENNSLITCATYLTTSTSTSTTTESTTLSTSTTLKPVETSTTTKRPKRQRCYPVREHGLKN